jgi:hypothetical protein
MARRKNWAKSRWGIVNKYRSTRRSLARGPGSGLRGFLKARKTYRRRRYGYYEAEMNFFKKVRAAANRRSNTKSWNTGYYPKALRKKYGSATAKSFRRAYRKRTYW